MCVINKDGKLKARWKHEKWCDQHATSTGQRNLWYSPACHECLGGSVVRASDRCTGGQRFNFCRGLRFFSLSSARDMLITSFLISSPSLKSIVCLIFFLFNPFTARVLDGVLKCDSNFWVCGQNPMMWPFKWKLSACTFTWCYLFFKISQNKIWKFGRSLLLAKLGSERVKKLVFLLVGYFVCVVWYCSVCFRSFVLRQSQ